MKKLFYLILIILTLSPSLILSATNDTLKDNAYASIQNAKQDMEAMANANFSFQYINDTLFETEQIYIVQSSKKQQKGDYALVLSKTQKITETKSKAFSVYDELMTLKDSLAQEKENISEALSLYEQAKQEFYDERYDQARELIDQSYNKAMETQAAAAKMKAIYSAGAKGIKNFIKNNYTEIIIFIILISSAYFAFNKKIRTALIDKKINNLKFERDIIRELIKTTQKDYFETGTIPESVYQIRLEKYGELIRDINREVPLLEEKKQSIESKKNTPSPIENINKEFKEKHEKTKSHVENLKKQVNFHEEKLKQIKVQQEIKKELYKKQERRNKKIFNQSKPKLKEYLTNLKEIMHQKKEERKKKDMCKLIDKEIAKRKIKKKH